MILLRTSEPGWDSLLHTIRNLAERGVMSMQCFGHRLNEIAALYAIRRTSNSKTRDEIVSAQPSATLLSTATSSDRDRGPSQ